MRKLKSLAKRYRSMKEDVERLKHELWENPYLGKDLGNHLHKIRLAVTSKGKGKRGGVRVITYTVSVIDGEVEVTLLTIYDKSEQENISNCEMQQILKENGL